MKSEALIACTRRARVVSTIVAAVAINIGCPALSTAATAFRRGVCDRQAEKLVGDKPVRQSASMRPPRRIRGGPAKLPTRDTPTTGAGVWVAEALIDRNGKIRELWVLREPTLTPPWPEFNRAIERSVRQWEYEPPIVNGARVSVCMTVTMTIDWW